MSGKPAISVLRREEQECSWSSSDRKFGLTSEHQTTEKCCLKLVGVFHDPRLYPDVHMHAHTHICIYITHKYSIQHIKKKKMLPTLLKGVMRIVMTYYFYFSIYFIHMGTLAASISMHHSHAWYPWKPEEGTRTGITDSWIFLVGWLVGSVLFKTDSIMCLWLFWNSLCRQVRLQFRDPPLVSASKVLGLKVCTTTL